MQEPTITQNGALFLAHRARGTARRAWFGFARRTPQRRRLEAAAAEKDLHGVKRGEGSFIHFREPRSA